MKFLLSLILGFTLNAHAFSEEEVVALTILGEARGEGAAGMWSVANVIQKRSIERKLSPSKVCLAPKQFSFWNDGVSRKTANKLLSTKEAKYARFVAKHIVKGRLLQDLTNGANHYHTKAVKPRWSDPSKVVAVINNHIFYRL